MNNKTEKSKTEKRTRPLVYVAVIICFVTGGCSGKLIKRPVNVTVFEGERTILECVTDFHDLQHTIFWRFENEDIFYGGEISLQYTSKFGIQKDETKGIYNLIIPIATKSHNGRYTCADDEGEGEKSHAWLTVAVFTELPTTEANGNSSASTGTDTMTIIIAIASIAVALFAAVIIAVVICIRRWNKPRSPENGVLLETAEPGVQMQQDSAANMPSAPGSTKTKNEDVITDPYPDPAKVREDFERRIENETGKPSSTKHGLKPKNSMQEEKEISPTSEEQGKTPFESKDNAEPVVAARNDYPVPQVKDTFARRLEAGPLEHS